MAQLRHESFIKPIIDDDAWSIKKIIDFSRSPQIDWLLSAEEYVYKEVIELDEIFLSDIDRD